MTCERFDSTETFERYLAGTLSDPERDAFEEHYFGCDRCFEALRILRATREALRAAGPLVPATPIRRPRRALWAGIGIAAALFAAALILPRFRSAPPASPPIAQAPAPAPRSGDFELEARMEPPAWDPQLLRGAESTVNPR